MANTINPGDRIKDNDPRMGDRVLTVLRITPAGPFGGHQWAVCAHPLFRGREIRIRPDRIHTDGKPRRTGFTLLESANG